jgi:hypothetical protein
MWRELSQTDTKTVQPPWIGVLGRLWRPGAGSDPGKSPCPSICTGDLMRAHSMFLQRIESSVCRVPGWMDGAEMRLLSADDRI